MKWLVVAVLSLFAVGCASTPRTTITPEVLEATHSDRRERPGIQETLVIEITPPSNKPSPVEGAVKKVDEQPTEFRDAIQSAVENANGSRVRIEYRRTVPLTVDEINNAVTDTGPGLEQRGQEQTTDLSRNPRDIDLPWGSGREANARGGGFSVVTEIIGGTGVNILHVLGGLCVLGAIVPIVLPPRRLGLAVAIAGTGMTLIAAGTVHEEYPWIFALVILAFFGTMGWLAYDAWRSKRRQLAIETIVPAVEKLDDPQIVKDHISARTENNPTVKKAVKAEVLSTKTRLNL